MKIIAIGELLIDQFYTDNRLLSTNGGGTSWNALSHLHTMKYHCHALGFAGNDSLGQQAIKSLGKIDTKHCFLINDYKTKVVEIHVDKQGETTVKCPNHHQLIPSNVMTTLHEKIELIVSKDDYVIFDELNDVAVLNMNVSFQKEAKIILDLGYLGRMSNLSKESKLILSNLSFIYLQINHDILDTVLQYFDVPNIQNMIQTYSIDLLIITHGTKDIVVYQNQSRYNYVVNIEEEVADVTGSGDAFLSSIIDSIIQGRQVDKMIKEANQFVVHILKKIGAR